MFLFNSEARRIQDVALTDTKDAMQDKITVWEIIIMHGCKMAHETGIKWTDRVYFKSTWPVFTLLLYQNRRVLLLIIHSDLKYVNMDRTDYKCAFEKLLKTGWPETQFSIHATSGESRARSSG